MLSMLSLERGEGIEEEKKVGGVKEEREGGKKREGEASRGWRERERERESTRRCV